MSPDDLNRARANFRMDDGFLYLNHAAHNPLMLSMRKAFDDYLNSWQSRAVHGRDPEFFQVMEKVRGNIAKLINTVSERVGIIPQTSYGLNILARGYRWNLGDNVILSEKEFPANIYPWLPLKKQGIELKFAKTNDGFIDEDNIINLADKKTKIIHLSWVQYNNGYRTDLKKLGDYCAENNILLSVDGIQGMGAVHFDIEDQNIDLFSFGCQKWMLGPTGTGFMYLSEKAESLIDMPWHGWLSVDWGVDFGNLMRYDLEPRKGPAKFEIATYSYHNIMAIDTAVEFFLSFDSKERWNHLKSITAKLIDWINGDERFKLISPRDDKRRSGIVVFKPSDPKACLNHLLSKNIIVSLREGNIRVSPHFYNNSEDIDVLIAALDQFGS